MKRGRRELSRYSSTNDIRLGQMSRPLSRNGSVGGSSEFLDDWERIDDGDSSDGPTQSPRRPATTTGMGSSFSGSRLSLRDCIDSRSATSTENYSTERHSSRPSSSAGSHSTDYISTTPTHSPYSASYNRQSKHQHQQLPPTSRPSTPKCYLKRPSSTGEVMVSPDVNRLFTSNQTGLVDRLYATETPNTNSIARANQKYGTSRDVSSGANQNRSSTPVERYQPPSRPLTPSASSSVKSAGSSLSIAGLSPIVYHPNDDDVKNIIEKVNEMYNSSHSINLLCD